jgi:serine protease Do
METAMNQFPPVEPTPRRVTTARRLILMASVAGLGLGVLFTGPGSNSLSAWSGSMHASSAQAAEVERPVGFADIVAKVKPAVIAVRVRIEESAQPELNSDNGQPVPPGMERFFKQFGMPQSKQVITGQGSGFFISADGYAVTNNHVVDSAKSVQVTTDDGKIYSAKVIGTDAKTDLALIKVEGRSDFPSVNLAGTAPRIGDWVLAVGNPFGLGGTVTAGIVSARGRDIGAGPYDDFIQIDAPVNKGNSGGPSFDVNGNVIGVNTAIFSPSGGSVGIAFAIPADTVKTVVAQLKDKGSVTRGWIGVQIQPVTPEIAESLGLKQAEGALVAEPQSGSPAEKAGIAAGDVITSVDGRPVRDAHALARTIGGMAPGTTVNLAVLNKGETKNLSLTLGELPRERQASNAPESGEPSGADVGRLGLTLVPADRVAGAGPSGVVVTAVAPGGPAADRGMKAGDVILDVGGRSVATPADVRRALSDIRKEGRQAALMRVKSDRGTRFVALPVGNG